MKHGLFANVVLLSHEPHSQFKALLCGLEQSLKPQGALEQVLVEKLATVLWRYRRLLQAESAEILNNIIASPNFQSTIDARTADDPVRHLHDSLSKIKGDGLMSGSESGEEL